MAYEKLFLQDGDTLTAEHIAHIEDGISNATPNIVQTTGDSETAVMSQKAVTDSLTPLNYASTTFTAPAGAYHSSKSNRVAISIAEGETYYVELKSSVALRYGCWETGADNTHTENTNTNENKRNTNEIVPFVATKDIAMVGVYIGTQTADVEYELIVHKSNSVLLKHSPTIAEFEEVANKLENVTNLDIYAGFKQDENPQRYGYGYNAYLHCEVGSIDPNTGSDLPTTTNRMQSDFITVLKSAYYEVSPAIRARVFKYSLDGEFISADSWSSDIVKKGWLESGYKYRFIFATAGWQLPTIEEIRSNIKIYCDNRHDFAQRDFLSAEVMDTVSKAEAERELSYSFIVVTDIHNNYEWNYQHWADTKLAIANINSLYPLDAIICLGDAIHGDLTASQSIDLLKRMRDDLLEISSNSFMLTGNHESNAWYDRTNRTELLRAADLYPVIARHSNTKVARNGVANYGYYDIDSLNIRVVLLDSNLDGEDSAIGDSYTWGYDTEQIEWVRDVALNTTKQVIFLSHMGVSREFSYGLSQPVNGVALRDVIEDFIAEGGVVVGMFHGHTHWDFMGKYSESNGFYEISTGVANGYRNSSSTNRPTEAVIEERTIGTATQELFDLVVVKPLSRSVKIIRFGAGNDRAFSY